MAFMAVSNGWGSRTTFIVTRARSHSWYRLCTTWMDVPSTGSEPSAAPASIRTVTERALRDAGGDPNFVDADSYEALPGNDALTVRKDALAGVVGSGVAGSAHGVNMHRLEMRYATIPTAGDRS